MHNVVSIELLDVGMVVHFQTPVKQMKPAPARSQEPFSQMMMAMLPKIMEGVLGEEEGEDWSEEKRAKKEMMKVAMEKAQEALHPQPKEEWVWSQIRVVVADAKDLPTVIEEARKAQEMAKKIRANGEFISVAGHLAGGLGDYIGGAVAPYYPPPTPFGQAELA